MAAVCIAWGAGILDCVAAVNAVTGCPTSLVLANQTLSGTQVFKAQNSITAGPNTTVPSGAAITFRSNTSRLEAGFSVQLGSTFRMESSANPRDF